MENTTTTLAAVSDATTDSTINIVVDINPQNNIEKWLQHWGILPCKKGFEIKPICLGTLFKISKILLSIELKMPDLKGENANGNLLDANYQAIVKHSGSMAEIVALAIQNDKHRVSKKLVTFILNNFTAKEMLGVLSLVLKQMDLTSFMSSIISIRGLNVLESPTVASVITANENEMSL